MVGLPEYRNGGLLVDLGLLTLTDKAKSEAISENEGIYKFSPSSQTVIEWRAITVIALYVFSLLPPKWSVVSLNSFLRPARE